MKIWLLTQKDNEGYGNYDKCVVSANTEEEARQMHPDQESIYMTGINLWEGVERTGWFMLDGNSRRTLKSGDWATSPDSVIATCLGEADKSITTNSVICVSYWGVS